MVWVNFATVWYTRNNGLRGPLALPQAQFHQFVATGHWASKKVALWLTKFGGCGATSPLCGIPEIMACMALFRFHRPSSSSPSLLGTWGPKRWPCGPLSLEWSGSISPLCGALQIMACMALFRFHRPSSTSSPSPLGTGCPNRWPCGSKFGMVWVNFATVWYTRNNGLHGPVPLPQAQFHQFTFATGHWVSKNVAH